MGKGTDETDDGNAVVEAAVYEDLRAAFEDLIAAVDDYALGVFDKDDLFRALRQARAEIQS